MSFFVKRPPPENGQPEKTAVFPTPALNHEAVYFVKGYAISMIFLSFCRHYFHQPHQHSFPLFFHVIKKLPRTGQLSSTS